MWLRNACTRVPRGRPSRGRRKKSWSPLAEIWPTISVSFAIAGALAGSSFGSQFSVTLTGAWPCGADFEVANAVTFASEVNVPSVRPEYASNDSTMCVIAAPPAQGFGDGEAAIVAANSVTGLPVVQVVVVCC